MAPRKTPEQKKTALKAKIAKKEAQQDKLLNAINLMAIRYQDGEDRQEVRKMKLETMGKKYDKLSEAIDALVKEHDAHGGDPYHAVAKKKGGRPPKAKPVAVMNTVAVESAPAKKPRAKRVATQKQLDALARGRAAKAKKREEM